MSADYHRPKELQAALDILARDAPRIAAGCTDLFPATERKILTGPVLDITAIPALRGISRGDNGLRIGATTTWAEIIRADLPPAFNGLKLAAREVGAKQIQNQGTIAGNLCNASPAADGAPPLLTLDARLELASAEGLRVIALQDFIKGPRQVDLKSGEMVTALLIPESGATGKGHFLKLGARDYLVISIAMTAARITLEEGIVKEAALAVGSCGPVATRLPELEKQLAGQPLDPQLITDEEVAAHLSPIDDMRADAAYRASSAAELLRRTLSDLAEPREAAA